MPDVATSAVIALTIVALAMAWLIAKVLEDRRQAGNEGERRTLASIRIVKEFFQTEKEKDKNE